eukprot:8975877-Alexandrium_andersonii.AAC.1
MGPGPPGRSPPPPTSGRIPGRVEAPNVWPFQCPLATRRAIEATGPPGRPARCMRGAIGQTGPVLPIPMPMPEPP